MRVVVVGGVTLDLVARPTASDAYRTCPQLTLQLRCPHRTQFEHHNHCRVHASVIHSRTLPITGPCDPSFYASCVANGSPHEVNSAFSDCVKPNTDSEQHPHPRGGSAGLDISSGLIPVGLTVRIP